MEERFRVRIKFKKDGAMKFIGHLDVLRFFQKLIRRAGLDVAYSEGFHPHQLLSFANPLGVGLLSRGEYADLVMKSRPDCSQMVERLNAATVPGFEIVGAALLPEEADNGMAAVAMADYLVEGIHGKDMEWAQECCLQILEKEELIIEKHTKKGVRDFDIRPGIRELEYRPGEGVFMKLSAGSVLNIRPEQVYRAMLGLAGREEEEYAITRIEQYDAEGRILLEV